jgi:NitT/TauT family transport system ATP-binding protein
MRTLPVGLPAERDYAQVMTDPGFGTLTREIRSLLGSQASH